jgi:hypothetical protein
MHRIEPSEAGTGGAPVPCDEFGYAVPYFFFGLQNIPGASRQRTRCR